jgi:hypothetical protein
MCFLALRRADVRHPPVLDFLQDRLFPMPEPTPCTHKNRRLVAKDQDAEYVECLDCGAILERGELGDTSGFNESLSDA